MRAPRRAGRATPAARATIDRRPSAPTTTRARMRRRSTRPDRAARAGRLAGSAVVTAQPRRTSAPAARASSRRAGSRRDRSKPDGRLAAHVGAVGEPERGPAGGLDPHRGDRPGHGPQSVASPRPARRRAATAAGEVKTPPARQRQVGIRSRTTTSWPAPGERSGEHGAGRPAADDRDLDPLGSSLAAPHAGRRPDPSPRRRPRRRSHSAGRTRRGSSAPASGRRPAAARPSRPAGRPAAPTGSRRGGCTGSPSAGGPGARPRASRAGCDARSLTTTPSRATRPISRSSVDRAPSGSQWWSTSEAWATSNERSG